MRRSLSPHGEERRRHVSNHQGTQGLLRSLLRMRSELALCTGARVYPKNVACNPKPIDALKTAWMVSNSRPLTTVSTNGKTIRPSGSMMLATKAT